VPEAIAEYSPFPTSRVTVTLAEMQDLRIALVLRTDMRTIRSLQHGIDIPCHR
jgi:hypothetical protein